VYSKVGTAQQQLMLLFTFIYNMLFANSGKDRQHSILL